MNADHWFMQLIEGLYDSGLMLLGQKRHPNNAIIKDLNEVNRIINILMSLEVKTKGNLEPRQKSRLREIITRLQVLYIKEMNNK